MKRSAFPAAAALCALAFFYGAPVSARADAAEAPTAVAEDALDASALLSGAASVDPFEIEPLRERFLARNGSVFVKIFLSADGPESGEIAAALDLSAWIARVAEAKGTVPVETEPDDPKSLAELPTGIYVGNTRAAARLGIFAPAGEGETSVTETRGNAVFIVGRTPTATRIAAGDFLRRVLGVEFVWPGADGAEWTPRREIPFPRACVENVPAFPWRLVGVGDPEWSVHLGFGDMPRFSHNIGGIFTKEIYAEKPELAPTVFGERRSDISGYYAPQPNLTAPAAVPVTLDAARAFFGKNPDAPMFALGINDTTNWDESLASENAYGSLSFFRNLPNRSAYYYDFVNRTAEAFLEDEALADKCVGAIAYMDVQDAPPFPLRENVVPVLCADRSMWVFPSFKEEDKALMRRWASSGVKTWGVYDYYYGSPFLIPRLFLREEAEAIKFVHENGGKIFYAECSPVVPFDAPKVWLASRLLRDPSADPEKILDDYYALTFGAAAPAMKKFYDFACETWRNQGGQCRWIKGWNNENSAEIFPPEKLIAARAFIAEAQSALAEANGGETPTAARDRRVAARVAAADSALSRLENFSKSYFARKALGNAEMKTFEETFEALKSPAWRYEDIYDDVDYAGEPFAAKISSYLVSDPRPAALERVMNFLKETKDAERRALLGRGLERVFGKTLEDAAKGRSRGVPAPAASAADARLRVLMESVPAMEADAPDVRESFEPGGFVSYEPGDWRAGKNLFYPRGWRCILAAAENLEMNASESAPHGGDASWRVSGAERVELVKRYRVAPGRKVLAQVFARGNVSCGSISCVLVEFFGADGKPLSRGTESLPVGETRDWRRLAALGEAPRGTASVEVRVYVGLQGEGDETFFDDLTVSFF